MCAMLQTLLLPRGQYIMIYTEFQCVIITNDILTNQYVTPNTNLKGQTLGHKGYHTLAKERLYVVKIPFEHSR